MLNIQSQRRLIRFKAFLVSQRGGTNQSRSDHGFTLIEVLVAFTIFAMILGLLFEAVNSTQKVLRIANKGNAIFENVQSTLFRMHGEILSTYLNQNDPLTYFIGNPQSAGDEETDTLIFTSLAQTRLMQNAPVSHLMGVQYVLIPEKKGGEYILAHEQDTNLLSYGTQAVQAEPLLHHVLSLRLFYFDGHEWVNQWNSVQSHLLPVYVKLILKVRDGKKGEKTFTDVIPVPLSTMMQNQTGGVSPGG